MIQCLGYWLFRRAGAVASRCNFAHVTVNGVDKGIYSHIESIKTELLSRHFDDASGNLYEGQVSDFSSGLAVTYQPKTNEQQSDGSDIAWDLIRLAWASVANTAITTVQDLLSLGHEARMNMPSTVGAPNWCWRLLPGALTDEIAGRLLKLTAVYGRME